MTTLDPDVCPACGGSPYAPDGVSRCPRCRGTGTAAGAPVAVDVPPGAPLHEPARLAATYTLTVEVHDRGDPADLPTPRSVASYVETGLVTLGGVYPGAARVHCARLAADAPGVGRETSFAPGVVDRDGNTIYPTGDEWLMAFALRGCQWAVDAVNARLAETAADAPEVRREVVRANDLPGSLEATDDSRVRIYASGSSMPTVMLSRAEAARRLLAFDALLAACERALHCLTEETEEEWRQSQMHPEAPYHFLWAALRAAKP